MDLNNRMPPRKLVLRLIYSVLFLLFFENNCFGGQWTMMFYMAADNDLYSQALIDIKELQKISGKPGVDIIVQLDSPSGAVRYKVMPQGLTILASLGSSNSGSGQTLADFGIWAVKAYPAQKYMLTLWDHGDGWSKQFKYIGYDQYFNDYLSVAGGELREALGEISSTASQQIDLVIFDACYMQMAEVLLEMNGLCRYAVGSEAGFPVAGMPYDIAWKDINGDTPAESLAVWLVNSCNIYEDLGAQTTCSAVDIAILSQAAQNLKSLVDSIRKIPAAALVSPDVISDSSLNFPPVSSYDLPGMLGFIGTRLPEPEKTRVLSASQQFKNSVLKQTVTGEWYKKSNGLAVWYPIGKYNFESGIDLYSSLNWSDLSGWDKILHRLIFQQDSSAPVPQKIKLFQESGGVLKLNWESGYEPSGIKAYQIRHSQNLTTTFLDQGGNTDSSNWDKVGFTITLRDDGATTYFSIGGQMTSRNSIQFDSSGNIGFGAEGIWGSIILESCSDTAIGWDTLGTWNFYREGPPKYCSAKVKTTQARIRISWIPVSGGYGVYIDDIKVCHPDSTKEIKEVNPSSLFYILNSQPGTEGFYQIRSIDSLLNQSSWSDVRFYQPAAGFVRTWPNPLKDKIFLLFSSSNERMQEVKIFNILGQFIDEMSLQQKKTTGGTSEYLYYWVPKESQSSGVYIARLSSGQSIRSVKMILIR